MCVLSMPAAASCNGSCEARASVSEILVIGFGNSLRQDDGFGPSVIEELSTRVRDPRVEMLVRGTLTPELAEPLARVQYAFFVDASSELRPGEFQRRAVACNDKADVSLVHFLSPDALLVWTERIYGRVPRAELWLVGVEKTELGEELTPTVAQRVPEVVAELALAIAQLLPGGVVA